MRIGISKDIPWELKESLLEKGGRYERLPEPGEVDTGGGICPKWESAVI